jgi:hypothetical protein
MQRNLDIKVFFPRWNVQEKVACGVEEIHSSEVLCPEIEGGSLDVKFRA